MKRVIAALTISSACVALLYAGPEAIPSSGKEMKQVMQPVAPPCPSWSGFYIGAFGGYKFGATDVDLNLDDFAQGQSAASIVEDRGEPDFDASGGEVGGLLGYNFQLQSHWVFGVEAAGGYLWLRDSEVTGHILAPGDNDFRVSTSFKTNYLFTAGPRIGYAFCRWLPFITGGVAVGNIDFEQNIHRHVTQSHGTFDEGGQAEETNAGWMAGGGLEYAITNRWKARVQYEFVDLGDVDFDHDSTEVDFSPGSSNFELREHNASFSLIYSF